MKKIFLFFSNLLALLSLCSCKFVEDMFSYENLFEPVECGDFIYTTSMLRDGYCKLIGISEEGAKKETLVFPAILDDFLVDNIGHQVGYHSSYTVLITNAKNVYFPSVYIQPDIIGYELDDEHKINIYAANSSRSIYVDVEYRENTNIFITYDEYAFYVDTFEDLSSNYKPANVCYYIDEETAFFVDDCDGTVVNVIPPVPYKEGYVFKGWYKDLEYTTLWDFENDVVPAKEYDENGNYIFSETKIYAKWEQE